MEAFVTHTGRALPLRRANVDTDQIIPAVYLKRVSRDGFGDGLFAAWREDPSFVLNDARYAGATILVAGTDFGIGSSRETAVFGLMSFGIRCVIAPNFGDIFFTNSLKNGLLPVRLPALTVETLTQQLLDQRGAQLTVDLPSQAVTGPDGKIHCFEIEPLSKRRLLRGLDEIAHTQEYQAVIERFEDDQKTSFPWLNS